MTKDIKKDVKEADELVFIKDLKTTNPGEMNSSINELIQTVNLLKSTVDSMSGEKQLANEKLTKLSKELKGLVKELAEVKKNK